MEVTLDHARYTNQGGKTWWLMLSTNVLELVNEPDLIIKLNEKAAERTRVHIEDNKFCEETLTELLLTHGAPVLVKALHNILQGCESASELGEFGDKMLEDFYTICVDQL